MDRQEIEDAIERLRKISHGARTYTALEVVMAVIPDGSWVDGLIDLLRQADPDTHMELPKDADGVPIHIGDVMAYADNTKPMEVVALVPPAVFLTEDGPRYADMCRHYHRPTVEDVLKEMYLNATHGEYASLDDVIAEYAQRLRLKDADDE